MQHSNLSSMIFPYSKPLPEILEQPRLREEVLQQIHSDSKTLFHFNQLAPPDQEALLEFCMGNRGLQVTYDPFFNNIFHPVNHPGRLSRFLSAILKQPVTVKEVLPKEGIRLSAEASLMIMDILVELADGSLINVEMQKVGYDFPVERVFCYGADLLVRQYDRIRDERKKKFTYRDMRPVYVIVLMEISPAMFSQYPECYIHQSTFQMNSGLSFENLLNFTFIPLDIFMQMPHNELTELEAWLYFLGSDNPQHIQRIIEKYPFFKELYKDIIDLRYHPKELITMFSESLRILDSNTIDFMIDNLKQTIAEQASKITENENTIAEQASEITEKDNTIAEQASEITEKDNTIAVQASEITEKDNTIAVQASEITEKDNTIAVQASEITEKDLEIAQLRAQLAKVQAQKSEKDKQ